MAEAEGPAPAMIPRFVRTFDAPDEYTYDIIWTDRLTGKVVMSYDGADPANTNPAYGAKSDSDCFAAKGLKIDEEIELGQSVIPVPESEVEFHAGRKRAKEQRAREDAEALDLIGFLGSDAEKFDFEDYSAGEREILKPALEKRGYTAIGFYMIEQDSFGPLIRGCVALCHCGRRVRFFYG